VIHRRSVEERERLLAEFARTGHSQKRFCRENHLPLSTLTYWLHQERRRGSRPLERQLVQVPQVVASVCTPDAEAPAAGTVQIRLPNQIELMVGVGADPAWVGALLQRVLTCSG